MNTVADNQFSSTRPAPTIPVATPQVGDTKVALLAKLVAATTGTAGGTSSGAATHINGSITTGGAAQTLQIATARKLFYVRNTSAGNLRVTYDGTDPSVSVGQLLEPGETWENPPQWCPQAIVKVWGATTGQTYEAITA